MPIALEELALAYELTTIPLDPAELRSADYLRINSNAKIPAIRHRGGTDVPVTALESGAILLYLAESSGGLLGETPIVRGQALSWLFLQVAGLRPTMGNAAHFRALKSPDPPAIGRFEGEVARHFDILEVRLREVDWPNGGSYSVADMAHFSWVRSASYAGFDRKDFPSLNARVAKVAARDGTTQALARLA